MLTMALFADVDNLYYCVDKRFPGQKLNYEKYYDMVRGENVLLRAFAYGTEINDNNVGFKTCLKHIGFEPRYKKSKPSNKGESRINDWNVGIAMEVVRLIDRIDCVTIGSADPRLAPVVEWVIEKGVRCIVYACGISKELKSSADEFIEIRDDLLETKKPDII
jgi:uncharacterized LabA/DUF88 family protein